MPFVHMQLAAALVARRDFREGGEHYLAALRTDPKLARAHAGLATVYLRTGRKALAIESLRRALQINPANPTYRRQLQELTAAGP